MRGEYDSFFDVDIVNPLLKSIGGEMEGLMLLLLKFGVLCWHVGGGGGLEQKVIFRAS